MSYVKDEFNRADGGLGANWTQISGVASPVVIAGNGAQGTASADSASVWTAAAGPLNANQWAQLYTVSPNDGGNDGGPIVRANTTAYTFYVMDMGATTVGLAKVIASSFTSLVSNVSPMPRSMTIDANGTTIAMYFNGALVAKATDAAIDGTSVGGLEPGIFVFSNTIKYSLFEAGDSPRVNRTRWNNGGEFFGF